MQSQERHKIKDLLRKSRIASGKKYMKQADRRAVIDGYQALKNLGIFKEPTWACKRKELFNNPSQHFGCMRKE